MSPSLPGQRFGGDLTAEAVACIPAADLLARLDTAEAGVSATGAGTADATASLMASLMSNTGAVITWGYCCRDKMSA